MSESLIKRLVGAGVGVLCALMILFIGFWRTILIALLASSTSPYAAFHVRQSLKFTVVEILVGILSGALAFTFIVPIAGAIFLVILTVIKFICFFQICSGKAKEPAIIRNMKFLS